ncbi:hypothetical protein Pmani_032996 [Petrolisthes manimaculis]|uniref:Elongator complex protein 5 n=1 Tax=Petrolisthes manimaculis TaxID=1843537 RepID=A0AAE1NS04_9EUCA|nr:hypothetical protein Pmani_032996 [Petrolisthes manimaculis]
MAKTLLGKLFRVTEVPTPQSFLLTDTVEVCGRGLLYSLVNAHLRLDTDVLYLTTTHSTQDIKSHFMQEGTPGKLIVYDGSKDPCGWDGGEGGVLLNQPLPEIFSDRLTSGGTEDKKVVVVIDRYEHILCSQESLHLIRGLHTLIAKEAVEQVIVYCGRDTVEENTLTALAHIAAVTTHLLPSHPLTCKVVLRKPSGKVIKTHEEFTLTKELQVQDVRPVKKATTSLPPVENTEADTILASQTTFSLTLTEDQRAAKNKLLLPHTRVQQAGVGGQIHYTPDDVDDWDDDDPDDDLDI